MSRVDRSVGQALRWGRAGLLAAVAMVTGVAAHVAADGLLPGPVALGVLFGCCWLAAARSLGRPASTPRVIVLLVLGQTFIHGSLTALSGHRGDPRVTGAGPVAPPPVPHRPAMPVDGSGHRVGSFMDQMNAAHPVTNTPVQLTLPAPVQHLIADFSGPHAAMALAHLVATAAVGWWLAQGERMLWTILSLSAEGARGVGHTLLRLASGVRQATRVDTPIPAPVSPLEVWSGSPGSPGRLLGAGIVRRGPPARCPV